MRVKLILLFLFSFLLRLISLNQSIWLDEGITAKVVKTFDFLSIVKNFSPFDFHPPFYYLFLKFWTNIFGYSEISLRFPSIIFSLLSGFVVYRIGSLLAGKKLGFWAALFFLFNPLIVYYSQEARMYMIVTFFITSSLYYFLKIQKSKFKSQNENLKLKIDLFLMNIFISLSFLTFYGSIFFILAILFYFLFKKQYQYLILSTCYFLLSFLIISPLLYQQWLNSKISLSEVKNWSLVLGKANIKNLLLIPIKFSIGRISFYPKIFYWLTAFSFSFFVFYVLFKNLKSKIVLFYFFIFPIFLGFIISFFTPLLQYFRFIYLIPLMCLLLVNKLYKSNKIYVILAFGFLFWSFLYLFIPSFRREDWKSLSFYLKKNKIKEVYMIPSSSDPLIYYYPQIKINSLKNCQNGSFSLNKEKVFVIAYTAEIYGIDYKNCFKNNYQLVKEKNFRQITLEEYQTIFKKINL
jgi:uncharacterized membrane protein